MTNRKILFPALLCCTAVTVQALAADADTLPEPITLAQYDNASAPDQQKPVRPPKPDRPLFRYSYDFSIADDSNIRNAQNDADIREDLITSLTLHARGGKPMGRFSILSYGASATLEAFNDFADLNNINFNFNLRYRFANAAGFGAPIYSVGFKLGGVESELEMRDSAWISTSLEMSKRLTDALKMTLGLVHKQQEASSRVFDTLENRLFFNLDLDLTKSALLYGTYTLISGDIVSGATPTLQIVNAADAIEPDDAFGGTTANQFAYRLDADTQVITLGYNKIMTKSMSLDLSYRLVDSEAAGGIEYDREILRISLLGKF